MIKSNRVIIGFVYIIAIVGILYLLQSILSHDASNPLCQCMLCVNNRIPEDGEYLYNHYLFITSIIWITALIAIFHIIRQWTSRKKNRKHKRVNR